ncbi:MAG: hypothetical protein M0Q91_13895 [Methanoregula sp.]|jgi:ACT domain-containing protein|nr:hypothetical protein [Methanoregula sp.]
MLISIILNEKDIEMINKMHGAAAHVQIVIDTDRMESAKELSARLEDGVRIKPYVG